jgi:uncharacterized membrane protein AbrB (regulator of aidB expression)
MRFREPLQTQAVVVVSVLQAAVVAALELPAAWLVRLRLAAVVVVPEAEPRAQWACQAPKPSRFLQAWLLAKSGFFVAGPSDPTR